MSSPDSVFATLRPGMIVSANACMVALSSDTSARAGAASISRSAIGSAESTIAPAPSTDARCRKWRRESSEATAPRARSLSLGRSMGLKATLGGVDLPGQLEVVLREPALGVGGDRDRDLVPRDLEVRVVVHLLGDWGQPVDEVHRALEVVELEHLPDLVALARPTVEVRELPVDIGVVQK